MPRIDLSQYDTDKPEGFLENYSRWFDGLFDQPVRILELGIQRGGSLLLWADLFPRAVIAGLDLNPSPIDDTERIRTFQGFQQDSAVLDRIGREIAPKGFDIIVDDASHVGEHTLASFQHLYRNHLRAGGLYVIDDWSCAYWSDWIDGQDYQGVHDPPQVDSKHRIAQSVVRAIRASARPVAHRLERYPALRSRFRRVYFAAESASVQTRFPSHDHGMAGIIKQLIDAVGVIDHPAPIERVEVTRAQTLIVKPAAAKGGTTSFTPSLP